MFSSKVVRHVSFGVGSDRLLVEMHYFSNKYAYLGPAISLIAHIKESEKGQ